MDLTPTQERLIAWISTIAGDRKVEIRESAGRSVIVMVRGWESLLGRSAATVIVTIGPRGAMTGEAFGGFLSKDIVAEDTDSTRQLVLVYGKPAR